MEGTEAEIVQEHGGIGMKGTVQVYRWKEFDSYVRKALKIRSKTDSNAVLDTVATALISGSLLARHKDGYPLRNCPNATQLSLCYLSPIDVDRLPIMAAYGLSWVAYLIESTRPKPIPVKRQLKSIGWKATLQAEAARLWVEIKKVGAKPSLKGISLELHKFALNNNIRADRGKIPSQGYINTHVVSRKNWTTPK